MSQDIVNIWIVRFGKPPVIYQLRQGFFYQHSQNMVVVSTPGWRMGGICSNLLA